jgi:hypothetical protein
MKLIIIIFITMANIFTKHPKEVGETYFQHLWIALKYSFKLLLLFIIAFIHSFFPFIFKTTTSAKIIEMAEQLKNRK